MNSSAACKRLDEPIMCRHTLCLQGGRFLGNITLAQVKSFKLSDLTYVISTLGKCTLAQVKSLSVNYLTHSGLGWQGPGLEMHMNRTILCSYSIHLLIFTTTPLSLLLYTPLYIYNYLIINNPSWAMNWAKTWEMCLPNS